MRAQSAVDLVDRPEERLHPSSPVSVGHHDLFVWESRIENNPVGSYQREVRPDVQTQKRQHAEPR
jgi:hypothetical protein